MCYSQLIFVNLVLSMTIRLGSCTMVHSPKENEWVEEGRNISLVCATDHPWQWCYWERDISNNKTIYQTVQEYNYLYTSDPSIKFVHLTEKSCGIQIVGASAEAHQVCLLKTIITAIHINIGLYVLYVTCISYHRVYFIKDSCAYHYT